MRLSPGKARLRPGRACPILCVTCPLRGQAVSEHEGQVDEGLRPVLGRLPTEACMLDGEKDNFEHCVVVWEVALGSQDFAELKVQGLDGVGRVEDAADLAGIREERHDLVPSAPPELDDAWELFA